MKTPWNRLLLQYGTAIAALLVISVLALLLFTVAGVAILVTKVLVVIR